MPTPIRVLILEDRAADAELMLYELRRAGFAPEWQRVDTEADYLAALEARPSLILADWSLPQFSGLRALQLTCERDTDTPFIIVSGQIGEEAAVEAIRRGASDYLLKDRLARLGQAVRHALEEQQLRAEHRRAEAAVRRREAILEAITFAATRFLQSGDWERNIQEVLARLGSAAQVSRVHIFENHTASDGTLLAGRRYEWVAPDLGFRDQQAASRKLPPEDDLRQAASRQLQEFPWVAGGFARWVERMSAGELVWGHVREFPESERALLTAQGVLSIAVAPIFVRQKWWGAIGLSEECEAERAWSPAELDALRAAAGVIGAAIERGRSAVELERRATQLATLNEISRVVSTLTDLDRVLETIYEQTRRVLPLEVFFVCLYSAESEMVSYPLLYDGGQRYVGEVGTAPPDTVLGQVLRTKQGRLINRSPAELAACTPKAMLGDKTRASASMLFVPLVFGDRVVGVLSAQSYQLNAYTEEHLALLSGIGYQAAIAIENARLFEQIHRRAAELETLATISAALRLARSRAEIEAILLDRTCALLSADAGAIFSPEPDGRALRVVKALGWMKVLEDTLISLKDSIAGYVFTSGQPYIADDLAHDSRISPAARSHLPAAQRAALCVPLRTEQTVIGVLSLNRPAPRLFSVEEQRLLVAIAEMAGNALWRASLHEQIERDAAELARAYNATIEGWGRALELRDQETEGHTRRVTELTLRLARALGVAEDELEHIRRGALLHDIGKMGIPDSILLKPGELTREEWSTMRCHTTFAYDMLSPIAYLRSALDIPYCHHEKWDGTGYPRGLKGEEIPLAARIFAVADVWDALTHDRPYRPAWPPEQVFQYIREQAGSHFDPMVVEAFMKIIGEV